MERVFLIGTHLKEGGSTLRQSDESLDELARLAETAGGSVVGRALQPLAAPVPATFIGAGKVEELRARSAAKEFDTLVFDDELRPAQQKNLSELIPAKIVDRTRLILDIFARRARTREGILQVELAQLSYLLPRMTERYGRFEQQVGGIGTRGPGERKLEVEARYIRDRMARLKRQIDTVQQHREVARERRHNIPLPIVTIVGYTNAGKSTLLNKLVELYGQTKEPIYADDKLFATLDPTTRRIRLPSGRWALFTDTVGFINKLPHHLVAAFRSTLEETLDADILLHLVDAGDPRKEEHAATVLELLRSLEEEGGRSGRILTALNKSDLLSAREKAAHAHPGGGQAALPISAAKGTGLHALLARIEETLGSRMVETDVYVPFGKSRLLHSLYRLGKVESVSHRAGGTRLHLKLEKSHWNRLQKILQAP